MPADSSAPRFAPTRIRLIVLGFVCLLSMITYLDRACFPNVQEFVRESLGLKSIDDLGYALTAFQIAYALFEVPTGWLGDRFGPRKTLIRVVLWWSIFIALTGLVGKLAFFGNRVIIGLWGLVTVRFFFGVGEAGAYPNIARAIYNWFPLKERGRASGAVWMSARLMGGLTPIVVSTIMLDGLGMSWRWVLWVFGGIGVLWCIAWAFWFRDHPEQRPEVNEAERDLIRADAGPAEVHSGVPWGKIFSSRSVWALCLMYFGANYGWWFAMNYLPNFLQEQHGVAKGSLIGNICKGGPLLAGFVGCFIGGWLTDLYIARTGDKRQGRRIFGIAGHVLTGLALFVCLAFSRNLYIFAIALAMSGFFNDLTMGSAWAACQDIGKRYAAIVSGTMNMIGNVGGALTTFLTSYFLKMSKAHHAATLGIAVEDLTKEQLRDGLWDGYHINFALYGVAYLLAACCWFGLNANKPVENHDRS